MDMSPYMRRFAARRGLPPRLQGPELTRKEPCDFCGEKKAILLAKMDYWDLSDHDLVECSTCGLMQIDPMLTEENLALGCRAFYQFEKRQHGLKEIKRGCLRNFRKGVSFAMQLRAMGVKPSRSLELGAGDAYFSRGLKFVFPELDVWCLDVVPDIRSEIERQHGFKTTGVTAEALSPETVGHFDLVIGRDILEHVRKPLTVLKNIHAILTPGGVFHFITPNGYEDVWFTYGFWQLRRRPTEYLINHVSFFPTKTLRTKLEDIGFDLERWILFDFKGTMREGKGQRIDPKLIADVSQKRSAASTLQETERAPSFADVDPSEILNVPWMKNRMFARAFCHLRHRPRWYCDGDVGVGHEIYGIARRRE